MSDRPRRRGELDANFRVAALSDAHSFNGQNTEAFFIVFEAALSASPVFLRLLRGMPRVEW